MVSRKIKLSISLVASFAVLMTYLQVGSQSRKPASESRQLQLEGLNTKFHNLSQFLRDVQEKKSHLEVELPENAIEQKCNDFKTVRQSVGELSQVVQVAKKDWIKIDLRKAKQLIVSVKNIESLSEELVKSCHEPVSDDKLTMLRSEVLSAGFILQNLNNPFEVSENR